MNISIHLSFLPADADDQSHPAVTMPSQLRCAALKLQAKETLVFLRYICKLFSKWKGEKKRRIKKLKPVRFTKKEFLINFQARKPANIHLWVVRRMKYSRELEKSYLMKFTCHILKFTCPYSSQKEWYLLSLLKLEEAKSFLDFSNPCTINIHLHTLAHLHTHKYMLAFTYTHCLQIRNMLICHGLTI